MTHSFSRFVFLDTNILSQLAKDRTLWPGLTRYLLENDLTLALATQAAELADAPQLHNDLAALLTSLPSAIVKTWDTVVDEEVKAHPERRIDTLLTYPLNALLIDDDGPSKIRDFLASGSLLAVRQEQRDLATHMFKRLIKLKDNFPPSVGGSYKKEQAPLFASTLTIQWLAGQHQTFLQQFGSDVSGFHDAVFRSIRLYAFVLFYKYYLGGRTPRKRSDFADLSHLYALPYCAVAVVERDIAEILRQIQRHDRVLADTSVLNIDFLKTLDGARS
jgi:hypothetical protein